MASPCPEDDELTQFVERGLPEPRRAEIEVHCEACPRCREAVTWLVEAFAEPRVQDDPSTATLPRRGATLGRYAILDWIGAGAMGAVYAAFDPELDRRVALKILPPRERDDASQLRARFLAEARAMASISHPNVIAVHDVGTHGDLAFFAMELVEGETLAAWLASRSRTTREIVEVFAAAGRGLAAAHEGGLVHRDFKPGNVLVGRDGRVRVIDFGLARFTGESADTRPPEAKEPRWDLPDTRTGALLGTPAYMAPEQLEGDRSDASADQFAFCVSLYEALYDRRPFGGDSVVARAEAIREGPPRLGPGPRRVPRRLQRILVRGLSAEPGARHPSMAAVVDALTARPLARWGPVAAIVVAAAGTSVGIHGAMTEGTGPRCRLDSDRLAGVWDEPRRASLVSALTDGASPESAAGQTARWLAGRFDAYAARWLEMSHEICVATVERHEQSATMTDLRMSCLRRAEHQLRAHVDTAIEGGAELIPRAVDLAESLPPLRRCEDAESLAAGPPPPSSSQAGAVELSRGVIAKAYSGWASGDFAGARRVAREVEAEAEAIGYAPLQYEAALLRGEAGSRLPEREDAKAALDRALEGSLAIGDRPVAIRAAASLACLVSTELGQPEAGIAYGRTALGLTQRSDSLAASRAHALRCMGRALKQAGALEDAEAHQRQAIEALEREGEGRGVAVAKAQMELGQILVRRRRFAEARREYEQAARVLRDELGSESPDAVLASSELASVMADLGDYGAAEAEYRRALDVWSRAAGPRSGNVGIVHLKLGNLLYAQDRMDDAAAEFEAGQDVLTEALGPDHPTTLTIGAALANVWTQQGRLADALDAYRGVLARLRNTLPPEHPTIVQLRSATAQVEIQLGDHATAIETLAPTLAVCDAEKDVPADICGDVALVLARARLQTGDRAAAAARLADAERRYAAADAITDDVRVVIDELHADLGAN